ncbi:MAG: tRNA pseudouridine(55) synthase TruB [Candidatus Omnitrophica bacterium]|nr:tRNA pseudouridine(55) synthase TruB [Candidatus Omnitrophota bacterium]
MENIDGILIVDKPQGMTSHDVVDVVRRLYGTRKVGHAGTLDPMATGVLIMLIGKATKVSQDLSAEEKEYDATLVLGARSATGDAWGKLDRSEGPVDFTDDEIRAVFKQFEGEIEQTPPAYSAKKINGVKMYHLARKGKSIEARPQKISIKKISISKIALPEVSFELTCSKGTYVRQLCIDIGELLGCGGYLSALERRRSGRFTMSQANSLEELKKMNPAQLAERVLPV